MAARRFYLLFFSALVDSLIGSSASPYDEDSFVKVAAGNNVEIINDVDGKFTFIRRVCAFLRKRVVI